MIGHTPQRFVFAACLVMASGCIRHSLIQDFPRPAERLRAALHPATVALQEAGDARRLHMAIGIFAPYDSSVVVVLRHNVPERALTRLLGIDSTSIQQSGGTAYATPLITYRGLRDRRDVTLAVKVDSITWPRPQNWVVREFMDRRFVQAVDPSDDFLIVRPGEDVRVYAAVDLTTDGFQEDGRYQLHLEWTAVPVMANTRLSCGAKPMLVRDSLSKITCGPPAGVPARRSLEATTRMVSARYSVIAVLGALLGGIVMVIGRN